MKRYQFRLEAVLKLRRIKEESCRVELGRLLMELEKIDRQLSHEKTEIDNYFKIQEAAVKSGVTGGQLKAFPMLVAAKDRNIELLILAKAQQDRLIDEKKKELTVLRGELKVIENLKEKDNQAWRKALNKKIDQQVDEQTQIWLQNQGNKGII